jgi:ABC-type nickel/cobalt efflux system permease component RcnA
MIYSLANGILLAGLMITGAMALGMIATIFLFVGFTILVRERTLRVLQRTAWLGERLARALEILSAVLIIFFGLWLFATRAV